MLKLRTEKLSGTIIVDDTEIHVQQLTALDLERIRKKNTKEKGRGMHRRNIPNEYLIGLDMFCEMITGWGENICDHKGPLECTLENKKLVYKFDQIFVRDVTDEAAEFFTTREEEEEGN